jgi:hypothetical protein
MLVPDRALQALVDAVHDVGGWPVLGVVLGAMVVVVVAVVVGVGLATSAEHVVESQATIEGMTPRRVVELMADVEHWATWNPQVRSVRAEREYFRADLASGPPLRVRLLGTTLGSDEMDDYHTCEIEVTDWSNRSFSGRWRVHATKSASDTGTFVCAEESAVVHNFFVRGLMHLTLGLSSTLEATLRAIAAHDRCPILLLPSFVKSKMD